MRLGQERTKPFPNAVHSARPLKPKKDYVLSGTIGVGVLFFIFSLIQLNFDYSRLVKGVGDFFGMAGKMFPPKLEDFMIVTAAAVQSLQVAIVGTAVGIFISFFLSFLGASNIAPNKAILWAVNFFAALMRSIPTILWALIFIAALGMGPIPGILALAIHGLGMLIKVYAESIEEVDEGVLEGMKATGASWFQMVMQGILPIVLPSFLSWSLFRLEMNIRYSAVLGMVGAGGIGWELISKMRMYDLQAAMFIILYIFVIVFVIEQLGNTIKKKLIKM